MSHTTFKVALFNEIQNFSSEMRVLAAILHSVWYLYFISFILQTVIMYAD